jgi:hypothetical protein
MNIALIILVLVNAEVLAYLPLRGLVQVTSYHRNHKNSPGGSAAVRAGREPSLNGSEWWQQKDKIIPSVAIMSLCAAAVVSKTGVLEGFDVDQYISSVVEQIHELGTFGYLYFALVSASPCHSSDNATFIYKFTLMRRHT